VQAALARAEIALHPSVVETVPVSGRDREGIHGPNTRPAPPGNAYQVIVSDVGIWPDAPAEKGENPGSGDATLSTPA